MPEEIQDGHSVLRPRARLIKTIGEDLISSDIVAVLELVKNSYDADASIIEISFSGEVREVEEGENIKKSKVLLKDQASIAIADDGCGMTLKTIQTAWMEPATIMKKCTKISASKTRRYTGEKGIGRFASAKLSEKLKIITRAENDNEVVIDIDWMDFAKDEAYLDEITCSWQVRNPVEITKTGTILHLTDLNSDWDEEKFRALRITLSRLINPVAPIEDFLMELRLPEKLKELSGMVDPPDSINRPDYSIKGQVDSSGIATIEYSSRNQPENLFSKIDTSKQLKPIRVPRSGPFKYEFRVWDLETDSLQRLAKEIGSTTKNVRSDLNDLAGISIYRDHFRVLPYGEPKNDWLRLDLRRVNNPTLRISSNQIVGYISISLDENPDFKDQSNREGIVESDAFNDLQEMIKVLLNELESKRYEERPRKENKKNSESLFAQFSIEPIEKLISEKLSQDKEAEKVVKDTQNRIDESVKKVQNILSRYRKLSTLGLLVDVILHDGNQFLLKIDSETRLLQQELSKKALNESVVSKHMIVIREQRKLLAQLFKRLEPFGGRQRGRPRDIVLEDAIKNIFDIYKSELTEQKVEVILPESNNIVRVDEGELQMIFVNLLVNSLHWLQKVDERKILVAVDRLHDDLSITFSDSGPGIEKKYEELIFDPYFSRKPDGIGLGLTIVGELVSEYDGDFILVDNGPLDGATFKINLRSRI